MLNLGVKQDPVPQGLSLCLTLAKAQTADTKSHASSVQKRTNKYQFKGIQQCSSRHYHCLSTAIAGTWHQPWSHFFCLRLPRHYHCQRHYRLPQHYCCWNPEISRRHLRCQQVLPLHPKEGISAANSYFHYQLHFCCTQETCTSAAVTALPLHPRDLQFCCSHLTSIAPNKAPSSFFTTATPGGLSSTTNRIRLKRATPV
jgi:hypothetical protein